MLTGLWGTNVEMLVYNGSAGRRPERGNKEHMKESKLN